MPTVGKNVASSLNLGEKYAFIKQNTGYIFILLDLRHLGNIVTHTFKVSKCLKIIKLKTETPSIR